MGLVVYVYDEQYLGIDVYALLQCGWPKGTNTHSFTCTYSCIHPHILMYTPTHTHVYTHTTCTCITPPKQEMANGIYIRPHCCQGSPAIDECTEGHPVVRGHHGTSSIQHQKGGQHPIMDVVRDTGDKRECAGKMCIWLMCRRAHRVGAWIQV